MKTRIWLALITLYIAWGTTYLAIRFAVESIPPFFMTGMRFLVAGMILYFWRRLRGDPKPTLLHWRSAMIIGIFLLVGGIGGVTLAETYVPSGITALIVAATPLWVTLIEAVRPDGTRPTPASIVGVLIGLVGIFILVDPLTITAHQPTYNLLGIGVILLAALSWAIGSIYSHGAELPKSPLLSSGMELLAGGIGSILIGLSMGEARQLNFYAISMHSVLGLVYLIIIGSLVGYVCYTWLLRVAPTSQVVSYAYVNPLVAVVLGSLLAGEVLSLRMLIAAPLILLAVVLIHLRQSKTRLVISNSHAAHASAGDD